MSLGWNELKSRHNATRYIEIYFLLKYEEHSILFVYACVVWIEIKITMRIYMREMRTARRDVHVYFNVCIRTCACFVRMEK